MGIPRVVLWGARGPWETMGAHGVLTGAHGDAMGSPLGARGDGRNGTRSGWVVSRWVARLVSVTYKLVPRGPGGRWAKARHLENAPPFDTVSACCCLFYSDRAFLNNL